MQDSWYTGVHEHSIHSLSYIKNPLDGLFMVEIGVRKNKKLFPLKLLKTVIDGTPNYTY